MTALSFVWVHPYSQNSGCDTHKTPFHQSHFDCSILMGVGQIL